MIKPNNAWMKNFPLGRFGDSSAESDVAYRQRTNPSLVIDPYKRSLLEDHKSGIITKEELADLLAEYQELQNGPTTTASAL